MGPKLDAIVGSFAERQGHLEQALRSMVEELYKFNDEVLAEAKSLFHKEPVTQGDTSAGSCAEESFAVPVLLPQTPGVKRTRTALKKPSSPTSPPKTDRPSRAASRVARGVISKTANEKLGSKKRRPTEASSTQEDVTSKIIDTTLKSSSSGKSSCEESEPRGKKSESNSASKGVRFDGEPKDKRRKLSDVSPEKVLSFKASASESVEDEDEHDSGKDDIEIQADPEDNGDYITSEEEEALKSAESDEDSEEHEQMNAESTAEDEEEEFVTMSQESEETNDKPDEPRSSRRLSKTKNSESDDKSSLHTEIVHKEENIGDADSQPETLPKEATIEEPKRRMTRSVSQQKLPVEEPKRRMTRSVSQQKLPSEESKRRMTRSVSNQNLPEANTEDTKRVIKSIAQPVAKESDIVKSNNGKEERKKLTRSVSQQKIRSPYRDVEEKKTNTKNKDVDMVDLEKEEEETDEKSQDSVPIVKITPPSITEPEPESHKEAKSAQRQKITRAVSAAAVRNLPKVLGGAKAPSTSHLIAAAKASASKTGGGTRKITNQSPAVDNPSSSFASKFRSRLNGVANSPIKKMPCNITTTITSFLPGRPLRNQKPSVEQLMAQKEEDLKKKKEKEEEAIKRKEERDRQKREETKKANEARQQKALKVRQQKEKQKQEARIQQERENREKLEAIKKAQAMAEERRRKELEEEKKKKEEAERLRKLEEERKKGEEEKLAKKREEEKRQELLEKERQTKLQEETKREKIRVEQLKSQAAKGVNLNSTFTKPGDSTMSKPKENLNSTYNKNDNYEITPARHELPQEILEDPDNYDIANLKSDEETDDEDNPRKAPAKWAVGSLFKNAIFKQAVQPPDEDSIFYLQDASPRLEEIFPEQKRRFFHRTSSAVWERAPMTHKFK